MFMRLIKVDEEKRIVIGRATEEIADKVDEILDYASAKPEFEKWSSEIEKASKGKSKGNVREMHGAKVAGTVKQIHYNDAEKAIDMEVKVVADDAWKMVKEGAYTGFSIGGSYVRKWADPDNADLTRFTPRVVEVSLVDSPCVPTATFEAIKVDGSVEMRKFKTKETSMEPTQKWIAADGVTQFEKRADCMAFNEALAAKAITAPAEAALAKLDAALNKKEDETEEEKKKRLKKEKKEKEKENDDGDDDEKDEKDAEEYEKRTFSTEERQKLADSGAAMPDGSFPIENKQDLKNAIRAHGRAKDKDKAKAHIKTRAKALGATEELPDEWKSEGKEKKAAARAGIKKAMSEAMDSAQATHILTMLEDLLSGEEGEEEQEDELEECIARLKAFIASEVMEGTEKMVKAGARHSKADMEHLTAMSDHLHAAHEHAKDMVEKCMDMHKCMKGMGMAGHDMAEEGEAEKVASVLKQNDSLLKQTAAQGEMLTKMAKRLEEITPQIEEMSKLRDELNTPLLRKSRTGYATGAETTITKTDDNKNSGSDVTVFNTNGLSPAEARSRF